MLRLPIPAAKIKVNPNKFATLVKDESVMLVDVMKPKLMCVWSFLKDFLMWGEVSSAANPTLCSWIYLKLCVVLLSIVSSGSCACDWYVESDVAVVSLIRGILK